MIKCIFIAGHLMIVSPDNTKMFNFDNVLGFDGEYIYSPRVTRRFRGVNFVEQLPKCVADAEEDFEKEMEMKYEKG